MTLRPDLLKLWSKKENRELTFDELLSKITPAKTDSAEVQNGAPHATTSHHIVYTFLIAFVAVAVWGAILITILIFKNPDVAMQLLIPYFSYVAAFGAVIPFYLNKAKDENARKSSIIKNRIRLSLAKDIFELIRGGQMDSESISLVKILISDNDTQLIYPNNGGGPVISNQDTYSVPMTDEGGQNV